MPLKDIYDQLKSITVGTNTSSIDMKLDSAISDIASYKSESGRNGFIELVKTLIAQGSMSLDQFGQASPSPAAMGQGSRISRYKAYEAITANISYCNRALNVLVDNILSPDDITKTALEIKPKKYLDGETTSDDNCRNIREVIEKVKLEERLDLIIKNTLHLGDFFCEIADAKTALTSKSSFLSEALILENSFTHYNTNSVEELKISVSEGDKNDPKEFKLLMDYSSLDDVKVDGMTNVQDPKITNSNINNRKKDPTEIYLLYYDPKRVVKLQSELFPLCFGYLVFPSATFAPHLMIQNQIINTLCQKILQNVQTKIPGLKSENINQNDLKDMISKMISEGDSSKIMNIRYVPPDKMQHFCIPTTKFYPYGESIFDASQFSAKVLVALETALTVARINRSTEKRKIAIEIGLPRDARKLVEKLKEEFRKRKISIDSFGSVDTIPSMINTFEDVYVPQKDGKSYIDISTFNEGNMDVRSKVDELKMLRDQLIAGLGVPPSFIGIEENLSNKAALSEESILFARTIVNYQKFLSHQINELIEKIYKILDPEKALTMLDNIMISFPPPKSLQFERQSKYLNDLASLVETLERIGVPKEWSKRKYLTDIDWDDVNKYEIDQKIESDLKTNPDESSETGGYGGMPIGGMGVV